MTGATGFLGSNLLKALLDDNHEILVLKRPTSDLSRIENLLSGVKDLINIDLGSFERIFQMNKVDVILHCATHYGRGDVPPQELIEANLTLPLSILHAAAQYSVKLFVNTDTILDKRVSAYSLSKKQFLEWLQLYSEKLTCATVALEHFYGPGDDRTKFVTHLIQSLLSRVDHLDLTPGRQKRDFIYIDDIVSAFKVIIDASLGQSKGLHSYEVGTGEAIEISEFVKLVKELTDNQSTKLNFGALSYRENEVMDSKVDVSKLRKLGWAPKIPLREGLESTIEQERKNLK
jgi:nucleoside-diphosphate-sugar epimerase